MGTIIRLNTMAESKTCIACKKAKPATNENFFYRNRARGWLSSWCKACRAEKRDAYKDRELALQRERRGLKPCAECGTDSLAKGAMYCGPCLRARRRRKKKHDKAIYKGRLRKAMPVWADRLAIRDIYRNRPEGMHVDHIVPIRGELVCGLHVESNLQYLPGEINMKKSNSFNDGNHYSLEHGGRK